MKTLMTPGNCSAALASLVLAACASASTVQPTSAIEYLQKALGDAPPVQSIAFRVERRPGSEGWETTHEVIAAFPDCMWTQATFDTYHTSTGRPAGHHPMPIALATDGLRSWGQMSPSVGMDLEFPIGAPQPNGAQVKRLFPDITLATPHFFLERARTRPEELSSPRISREFVSIEWSSDNWPLTIDAHISRTDGTMNHFDLKRTRDGETCSVFVDSWITYEGVRWPASYRVRQAGQTTFTVRASGFRPAPASDQRLSFDHLAFRSVIATQPHDKVNAYDKLDYLRKNSCWNDASMIIEAIQGNEKMIAKGFASDLDAVNVMQAAFRAQLRSLQRN